MIPAGFLGFRAALARAAEARHASAWSAADPRERDFLLSTKETRGFEAVRATRAGSLACLAYDILRPALAAGVLPAMLRLRIGPSRPILASSWHATSADRIQDVIADRVTFVLEDGAITSGDVLIEQGNLEAFLKGKTVPRVPRDESARAPRLAPAGVKRGRPSNPEADAFWIETCRRVYCGELLKPLAPFVARMAEWSANNMAAPYDEETVRKKLAGLGRVLDRDDL